MKTLVIYVLFAATPLFISCGKEKEDCKTCETVLAQIQVNQEICPLDDGIVVTITFAGQTVIDTFPDISVSDYTSDLSTDPNYICN